MESFIFTKDMVSDYLTKSTPPIVKATINALLENKPLQNQGIALTAQYIFKKTPELNIDSIINIFGVPKGELFDSIKEQVVEQATETTDKHSSLKDGKNEETVILDCGQSDPPLEEEQTDTITIYRQKFSFEFREKDTPYGSSDEMLTRMALVCMGQNNFRRVRIHDYWLKWTGSRWKKCDKGDVRKMLGLLSVAVSSDLREIKKKKCLSHNWGEEIVKRRYGDGIKNPDKIFEKEQETLVAIKSRLESKPGKDAIVSLMGDSLAIDFDELDQNEDDLVFNNCCIDLATGKVSPPDRNALATRGINWDYTEASKEAKLRWQKFLDYFKYENDNLTFDDEVLRFLKRSFGYAALGRGTLKRFWWFRGEGGTLKTTLIQLVARCLDGYAESTATSLWISKGGSTPGHTDDLAALTGARLVYAEEFQKWHKFDDGLLKRVTSGSTPMRASAKGEKGFTYKVRFGLFCSSNFDPYLPEDDDASMKRLTSITFMKKPGVENVEFINDFLANHDNKMAITEWVIEGAKEYIQYGLGEEPNMVKESRGEFTSSQVSIKDQLKQLVKKAPTSPDNPLRRSEILEALTALQRRSGQKCMFTTKQINKILKDEFKATGKSSNGDYLFDGVVLKKKIYIEQQEYNEPETKSPVVLDDNGEIVF